MAYYFLECTNRDIIELCHNGKNKGIRQGLILELQDEFPKEKNPKDAHSHGTFSKSFSLLSSPFLQ